MLGLFASVLALLQVFLAVFPVHGEYYDDDLLPSLDGVWTTVHLPLGEGDSSSLPLHDAIRIASGEATCSHGGYDNMTVRSCRFASGPATLGPDGIAVRILGVEGKLFKKSANCSWVSHAPGKYWTGASAFPPPFTPSCARIELASGETWVRLRNITKVHVVSMSHLVCFVFFSVALLCP